MSFVVTARCDDGHVGLKADATAPPYVEWFCRYGATDRVFSCVLSLCFIGKLLPRSAHLPSLLSYKNMYNR
jgi:hypothetical protein